MNDHIQNEANVCPRCLSKNAGENCSICQNWSDERAREQRDWTLLRQRRKFQPGDVVEYCGEEAVVIENFGSSGAVRLVPEGRMTWYWAFQGVPVTLVRAAEITEFKPGDTVEFCGDQATVVENHGTEGVVEFQDKCRVTWQWTFDGVPVTLVRKANG